MNSSNLPAFAEVEDDLGAETLAAMGKSVDLARSDLSKYRQTFPAWVAQHSNRGLANWIHDRLWFHLTALLDEYPVVAVSDNGVTREITISSKYRIRAKRHDENMSTRNYPTQAALDFHVQPMLSPDFEEVRLSFGYIWDTEELAIKESVLSLHQGRELQWWATMPQGENVWTLAADSTTHVPTEVSVPGFGIELPNIKKRESDSK